MIHYLKNIDAIGYVSYMAFNEKNLTCLDFATTKSLEFNDNFTDKEDLIDTLKSRLKDGYYPIERVEFDIAFKDLNKRLNKIIKEL